VFDGSTRHVESRGLNVTLLIEGMQFTDGHIEREVCMCCYTNTDDHSAEACVLLDADGARRVGLALIDAADEMDELAEWADD
jgi:hypothetical protein